MSEPSPEPQVTSRLRLILMRLFQTFIVFCLVDGFLDIVYPALSLTKGYVEKRLSQARPSGAVEPGSVQDILRPLPSPSSREEPGIRGIVNKYHSAGTNVAADGLRSNGQLLSEKARSVGFLLGSSTAFGFGVADDQTLAAHLERRLKNVRVENYAGFAQPVPDNTLRWYDLQQRNKRPDFFIIAGANFQIYHDCVPHPANDSRNAMILVLAERVADTLSTKAAAAPCASNESLDLAVRRSILSIENAVSFGRKQGIPFHVVYLPTPYDANVNIDNLLKNTNFKLNVLRMQRIYSRYQEELDKLDLPEFINLARTLPSDKMYFLDAAGHLSADGNKLIAERLAERIWGGKD